MGYYSYDTKISFRKTDDYPETYFGEKGSFVDHEIWAGHGKWKRHVGMLRHGPEDYWKDEYTMRERIVWTVEMGDYQMRAGVASRDFDGSFTSLAKAKRAVKARYEGGIVDINCSTDVDYLRRITGPRDREELWSI